MTEQALLDRLAAALRLHGCRRKWDTLEDAVEEAAGRLLVQVDLMDRLRRALRTDWHEPISERAKHVMQALAAAHAELPAGPVRDLVSATLAGGRNGEAAT